MGSMIFLSRRAKNTKLRVTLTSSAMTKDHHTIFTLPVLLSSQAAGSRTTSWRQTEMIRLNMPLPSAWKVEDRMMLMPASRKWKQMMRRAGLPMASMASLAENRPSSLSGRNWNSRKPTSMMASA